MPDQNPSPVVVAVPGVTPSDGGKFLTPRNVLGALIVLVFVFDHVAPYYLTFPANEKAALMVLNGVETSKNILLIVLTFFFGTTFSSTQKDETIRQQALAMPNPPPPPAMISVDPPASIKIETPDDPDAPDVPGEAAAPAGAPGSEPRRVGPPE